MYRFISFLQALVMVGWIFVVLLFAISMLFLGKVESYESNITYSIDFLKDLITKDNGKTFYTDPNIWKVEG